VQDSAGEHAELLYKPHRFFDYGDAFDIAASVAVAWHGATSPSCDEGGIFDGVCHIVR